MIVLASLAAMSANLIHPLISIALPLADNASSELLERCLRSIEAQSFDDFEILVWLTENSSANVERVLLERNDITIIRGTTTKSAARNLLAQNSGARYILNIDVDMELTPGFLEACEKLISEEAAKAIVAPAVEVPNRGFWSECRALERELLQDDIGPSVPLIIEKSAFDEAGGYDEDLDMFDDWGFALRLLHDEVPFRRIDKPILIRETTDLREMFIRKFRRGQEMKLLTRKHPNAPYVQFRRRFRDSYFGNWRVAVRSPTVLLGLTFIKLIDMSGILLGSLFSKQIKSGNSAETYRSAHIAHDYDRLRLGNNFNRFKHFAESQALMDLLKDTSGSLCEVGCGTGRITQLTSAKGYRVIALDPSHEMLEQYKLKPLLPSPIWGDGRAIPIASSSVDAAYSIRVVWHLPTRIDYERFVFELARISTGVVVLDVANAERWNNPILKLVTGLVFLFRPKDRHSHATTQLLSPLEFDEIATRCANRVLKKIPLDVLSPIWLNILPEIAATPTFQAIRRLELLAAKWIPPGRYLILMGSTEINQKALDPKV